MRLSVQFFLVLMLCIPQRALCQEKCADIDIKPFRSGESIHYKATYHLGLINADAGFAEFRVLKVKLKKKEVFKFLAIGYSNPEHDWVYKVRDTLESYTDTVSLKPFKFVRNAKEGRREMHESAVFSKSRKKVYTFIYTARSSLKRDSIRIPDCTFDVLSGMYHVRSLDFSEVKEMDTIPVNLYIDNEFHQTYIRYLGKETINSAVYGKVPCIKFRGKLIEGDLFPEGELMTVWVTDDVNKIPVYIETEILVGRLKVYLQKVENTKYESILKAKKQ